MSNSLPAIYNPTNNKTVLLNNAATTPPLESTIAAVTDFMSTYSAFHRGSGPRAAATYAKTQAAVQTIKQFIGVPDTHELLFTTNTSGAINLFIRLLSLKSSDVILTSEIEHTSNNLPWQFNTQAQVVYVRAFDDGSLDYEDLELQTKIYQGRLKLIAITGAASLSGYIPDLSRVSLLAQAAGAMLFVDAAQLAPHRPINMQAQGIDALAFSAHKVYAPFGIGVLALPKTLLNHCPVDPGGGSIDMISKSGVIWSSPASRHQTGTWNVVGIVALAASCKAIMNSGWEAVVKHEREFVSYMASRLGEVSGLELYFDLKKYTQEDRIGTFVFNLPGVHYALLSAVLEHEYGIESRAGTICNHKLVRRWLKVSDIEQARIERDIRQGNRLASYGIVRVSLSMANTLTDIDALIIALKRILTTGPTRIYAPAPEEGIYTLT